MWDEVDEDSTSTAGLLLESGAHGFLDQRNVVLVLWDQSSLAHIFEQAIVHLTSFVLGSILQRQSYKCGENFSKAISIH